MHPQVAVIGGGLAVFLPALGARVGLGAGVDALVRPQVGLVAEGAPTAAAAERPLVRVDHLVHVQVGDLEEAFAALGAGEGPLVVVPPLVQLEAGQVPKGPRALAAPEQLPGAPRLPGRL